MDTLQTGDIKAFSNFFEQFHRILPDGFEQIEQDNLSFNGQILGNFFENIKVKYEPFVKQGGLINIWQIAGLKYEEVRNCGVLEWLLDCYGSHGQGVLFLHSILEPFSKSLGFSLEKLSNYSTCVEKTHISEGQVNRIDIEISNENIIIFIEAKIYAGEGEKQLERYSRTLEKLRGTREHAFLFFLTPSGYTPQIDVNVKYHPIAITWKMIAYAVENSIKAKIHKYDYKDSSLPLWAILAQQFCNHIRTF